MRWWPASLAALAVVAAAGLAGVQSWRAEAQARQHAAQITGGDPDRGRRLVAPRGCAGCHRIPGDRSPGGRTGPPLAGFAGRVYIAGVLPNSPPNLVRWIVDPKSVDPKTAMPRTGTSDQEAKDIAAFLYTLR
jgi:cytochrome c1